ncbi:MAG: amidohydrolase family protein [Coriobacteriales bacterium]|nr:amidohydrolase family protein [Coriobacteriales bacterium]
MKRIDVFAHVLLPGFYKKMLAIEPSIPERYAFFNNAVLQSVDEQRKYWDGETKQVISYVNCLPEDYCDTQTSARLCWEANEELLATTLANPDLYEACVAMVPMNNMDEAVRIVREQVLTNPQMVGVQVFTRALGKSIAEPEFQPLFVALAEAGLGAWLHPVFDLRKPDNNLVFSWEYELTQAQLQLVQAGIFKAAPGLKMLVHHAGGMVPFFAGRVDRILPPDQSADFHRFYVDTAILGNTAALELALDYYGADHVLFGTDAPLGIMPAGATAEIRAAIDAMRVSDAQREAIYATNYLQFIS